jgi:hypothetical protein
MHPRRTTSAPRAVAVCLTQRVQDVTAAQGVWRWQLIGRRYEAAHPSITLLHRRRPDHGIDAVIQSWF